MRRALLGLCIAITAGGLTQAIDANLEAPAFDPSLFSEFRWRPIGPFRGGRTKAVDGVASAPHVFYIGADRNATEFGRDAYRRPEVMELDRSAFKRHFKI